MAEGDGLVMKYFVLKPAGNTLHAQASREAMRTYASLIRTEQPAFADDLLFWARDEEVKAHG